MKRTLTILFLLFIHLSIFGQNQFTEGKTFKTKNRAKALSAIVPSKDNEHLIVLFKEQKFLKGIKNIRVFDNDLKLVKKIRDDKYELLIKTKNKTFASFINKKEYKIAEFNTQSLEIKGQERTAIPRYKLPWRNLENSLLLGDLYTPKLIQSPNKELFGFFHLDHLKGMPVLKFAVYNENLEILNYDFLTIGINSENYLLKDVSLTNEGQIIATSQEIDPQNFEIQFIHSTLIEPDGGLKEYDTQVNNDNKQTYINKENNHYKLIVIGHDNEETTIISNIVLDQNFKEVSLVTNHIFPEDFHTHKRQKPFLNENFGETKEVYFNDDHILIFTEQTIYKFQPEETEPSSVIFKDLIVHCLNKNGKVVWSNVFPKFNFRDYGDGFKQGYSSSQDPNDANQTMIFLWDDKRNFNNESIERKEKENIIKVIRLNNKTGAYTERIFSEKNRSKIFWHLHPNFQNDRNMYIIGERYTKRKIVKFNLNNIE